MMKRPLKIFFLALLLVAEVAYAQCTTGEFEWPLDGPITSPTGWRKGRMHNGLDIGVNVGTPIYAAGGGTVTTFDDFEKGGGHVLVITHPNGMQTAYLHLSKYAVNNGDVVKQGQLIAYSGNTAFSDSPGDPHLHFEVRINGHRKIAQAKGTSWDTAAGAHVGTTIQKGKCISTGLGPGGKIEHDATTAPGNDPSTGTISEEKKKRIDECLRRKKLSMGGYLGADGEVIVDGLDAAEEQKLVEECTAEVEAGSGTINPGEIPENPPPVPGGAFTLTGVDLEALLPTPMVWINKTIATLNQFYIYGRLQTLGIILLFACFVYSLVNATAFYRSDEYFSLLLRLVIAAGLIFGSPAINEGIKNMWTYIYQEMEKQVVAPATTDLERHINNLSAVVLMSAGVAVRTSIMVAAMPDTVEVGVSAGVEAKAAIDAQEEIIKMIDQKVKEITRLLFSLLIMLGSLYGIYFLAILSSGIIVILAGALLPVLAPFVMLAGGSSWFVRWFTMVFLSLVTVTVFPFVFRVVVEQGVNAPIQQANDLGTAMMEQLDYLKRLAASTPENWWDMFGWVSYIKNVVTKAMMVANNFVTILFRWVFQSVILAISVIASIFLMQQIPSLLSGFIGGAFGGMANASTGGAFAGLLPSGVIGGGKKSSPKNDGPGAKPDRTPAPYRSGPRSTPAGGSRSLSSGGGGNAGALPQGSSPRAALPAAGGTSGGSGGGASSTGSQAQLAPSKPTSEGSLNARGNLSNDSSVTTIDTTAKRVG